jgi:hypothetical protein
MMKCGYRHQQQQQPGGCLKFELELLDVQQQQQQLLVARRRRGCQLGRIIVMNLWIIMNVLVQLGFIVCTPTTT